MPRKKESPNLLKSKIKIGRIIGIGQSLTKTVVRSAKIVERINGKKVKFYGIKKTNDKFDRKQIVVQQRVYRLLKKAGLPVPNFSRTHTINKNRFFGGTNIYMENVQKRCGKLFDCHNFGNPVFFKKFSAKKDSKLIKDLARDLATIHNLGITTSFVDFWHFYKIQGGLFKKNTWGRVIIDFDKFDLEKNRSHQDRIEREYKILTDIKHFSNEEVFKLFYQEYSLHAKNNFPFIQTNY
jgi:hypothetical protein